MNKKICFDCDREISPGREVRLREDGLGWGIGGGRYGRGWGGGEGWGSSGDAAFLWICTTCYRKRKRRRLLIFLIIVGILLFIIGGIVLVWFLRKSKV